MKVGWVEMEEEYEKWMAMGGRGGEGMWKGGEMSGRGSEGGIWKKVLGGDGGGGGI